MLLFIQCILFHFWGEDHNGYMYIFSFQIRKSPFPGSKSFQLCSVIKIQLYSYYTASSWNIHPYKWSRCDEFSTNSLQLPKLQKNITYKVIWESRANLPVSLFLPSQRLSFSSMNSKPFARSWFCQTKEKIHLKMWDLWTPFTWQNKHVQWDFYEAKQSNDSRRKSLCNQLFIYSNIQFQSRDWLPLSACIPHSTLNCSNACFRSSTQLPHPPKSPSRLYPPSACPASTHRCEWHDGRHF